MEVKAGDGKKDRRHIVCGRKTGNILFFLAEIFIDLFHHIVGHLSFDGEECRIDHTVGECCDELRGAFHGFRSNGSDGVVTAMDLGRAHSSAAHEVYAGDALIAEGNGVGGIDILCNAHGVADLFIEISDCMAYRFFAENDTSISAEQRTCHIHVDAENDLGKLLFMCSNVCLTAEKTSFFGAAPDEANGTLGRIFEIMAEHFKNGGRAAGVIKNAVAVNDGIVMCGVNDHFLGEFGAGDLGDDILRITFTFLLREGELDLFRLGSNHFHGICHADTNSGEFTVLDMLGAEHSLIEIEGVLIVTEGAGGGDHTNDAGVDELFEIIGTKTCRNKRDLALYIDQIDRFECFEINEIRLNTVARGVACKAVACYLIFLIYGRCDFELRCFDLVVRCFEGLDHGCDAE